MFSYVYHLFFPSKKPRAHSLAPDGFLARDYNLQMDFYYFIEKRQCQYLHLDLTQIFIRKLGIIGLASEPFQVTIRLSHYVRNLMFFEP